jgi:hypothetical protein
MLRGAYWWREGSYETTRGITFSDQNQLNGADPVLGSLVSGLSSVYLLLLPHLLFCSASSSSCGREQHRSAAGKC